MLLDIQPTGLRASREKFGLCSMLADFFYADIRPLGLLERQAQPVDSVSTMVLSEARGLSLFLVIRGGIT